ncbi:hypothetical protein [Maribacter sp. IgM3_T14_3]|uniref:hypothetical protein n=1 Tax=Maribacter sp. IgM3_T14_3 TaxID=3415140 RepID=UPI003C6FF5CC
MKYQFGKPKDLDSITKEDVLKNKVWLWTWEAGLEGDYDEDWQVPVIGLEDITSEFTEPIITLKILGTDLIASGSFNYKKSRIYGIAIWKNNSWEMITKSSLETPIRFESLIKIGGNEKTEFIMTDKNADEAFLKNM